MQIGNDKSQRANPFRLLLLRVCQKSNCKIFAFHHLMLHLLLVLHDTIRMYQNLKRCSRSIVLFHLHTGNINSVPQIQYPLALWFVRVHFGVLRHFGTKHGEILFTPCCRFDRNVTVHFTKEPALQKECCRCRFGWRWWHCVFAASKKKTTKTKLHTKLCKIDVQCLMSYKCASMWKKTDLKNKNATISHILIFYCHVFVFQYQSLQCEYYFLFLLIVLVSITQLWPRKFFFGAHNNTEPKQQEQATMSEEIDKHVIRKYEIGAKLGKGVRYIYWLRYFLFK